MKLNDIIELDITGQGMDGEGVGRYDNIAVFLPYTIKGERVAAKVTFVRKNFANASVIKVITPSPVRRQPVCPVYYKCGGCDLMHIDQTQHRALKEDSLINNFRKIAREDIRIDEFVESDSDIAYRNKIQIPFGMDNGRVAVGYFVNNSHRIVPYDECALVGKWAHDLTKIVVNFANECEISVYNEVDHCGTLRHLVMRKIGDTISMIIVINHERLALCEKLVNMLARSPYKVNLHLNINTSRTNVILGQEYILVKGTDKVTTNIMGVKAEISPQSFMQVNDFIRDKIYQKAASLLSNSEILIDLYSGVGITSNIMCKHVKHVYSIEIVREAVENARHMATLNGNSSRITCICGDVSYELPAIIAEIRDKYGANARVSVLLDPPRKGCDSQVIQALKSAMPEQIIYISCNHPTLSRDCNALIMQPCQRENTATATTSDVVLAAKSGVVTVSSQIAEQGGLRNSASGDLTTAVAMTDGVPIITDEQSENPSLGAIARGNSFSKDYDISFTGLFDMFPNTHHVETLVCLRTKSCVEKGGSPGTGNL